MHPTYHFIGIGGIGMSALARIMSERGCFVQGSDQRASPLLEELRKEGIFAHVGHDPERIQPGMTIVYSSDIKSQHIEIEKAKELSLPLLHRSELLDFAMQGKKPLLVTGTHGKTTTSSLLAHVLAEVGWAPSFAIGGIPHALKTNGHFGEGEFFVAEADESDRSFLQTKSFGAIVTNLENDHLSYWKTPEGLDAAFSEFFRGCQKPDLVLWCADDPRLRALHPPGFSYGFSEDASWKISDFQQDEGGILFSLSHRDQSYSLRASLFGRHNALNAAAVFALALQLGVSSSSLSQALPSFSGVKRRLEKKGEIGTVQFFDDYGHHPTEICATLGALREKIKEARLVVLFQPHRYTRVEELLDSFSAAFNAADLVVLTEIYAAGEPSIEGLFPSLQERLKKRLGSKLHSFSTEELIEGSLRLLRDHDVVLTIGAGDITQKGEQLMNQWAQICLHSGR